ncbi:hypothetical protein GGF37_002831, partial [Kickxella alabastrina]
MALENFDLQAFAQALSIPTQEALEALPQIQKQPIGWQFAFDLLKSSNFNCRFYGAHTLQVKIARDWDSLDEERQQALRPELIRLVAEQCDAPLNALATYALRTVPSEWSNFLPSVIESIQQSAQDAGKDSMRAGYAIVDFLELFPEELNRTAIGSAQQAKLVQDVKESLPFVLELLTGIVRGLPGSPEIENVPMFAKQLGQDYVWRTRAWKAILQWLQFGISGDTLFVPILEMGLHQLHILAAHQMSDDNVADDDEVDAALAVVEDMVSNVNMAAKYAQTVGTLVLTRLNQPWFSSILKMTIDNCDEQHAMRWSSVLISFAETHIEFLVTMITSRELSGHIATLLQMMLALTRFPGYNGISESLSDQPLNFWYLLQETLVDYMAEASDDPESAQKVAETKLRIKVGFVELLRALVSKSAYPPTETWIDADKEERDHFMSYRRDVADAILNAYYVLRGDMLQLLVDEVINNMGTFSLANWQTIESILFALKSVGEAVPESESDHLPRLFSAELLTHNFMPVLQTSIDGDNRATQWGLTSIKASIISLIGAYGEWWKGHPELLPIVLPCMTSSLNQPALVQAAVAAFRRICDSCREQLADAADSMVNLAREVLLAGSAVPAREQQRIFESVAEVVMVQSPDNQTVVLAPLLSSLAAALDKSVQFLEAAPSGASLADLGPFLAPLIDTLRLVDSLARGLQFPDDVEERALMGDQEAVAALTYATQCYCSSSDMHEFRLTLLGLLNRVLTLSAWIRDPLSGMLQMDDTLVECLLAIINSSTRRGPHLLAFGFGEAVDFVGNAWAAVIARPTNGNSGGAVAFGLRWSDQCPAFLQCISQLVTVFSAASDEWQPTKPSVSDCDRMLGAILTRIIDDIYIGISREVATLIIAIEQQPVINEYIFDLCTRVLQTRPALFACLDQAAVGHLCELSVQALSVPNRLALKPTAYFLTALIRLSSS